VGEVQTLVDQGHFADAEKAIAAKVSDSRLSVADRHELEFERERMRRMRLDFSLSRTAAVAKARAQIPDLKDDEFSKWDDAGLLEHLVIDGETRYFSRAPSNLFRVSTEARARRSKQTPFNDSPLQQIHPHHREVLDVARRSDATSIAPRRVRVTYSIKVQPDAVPAGENVRAWIPYPRAIPGQQEGITLVASTPSKATIAPAEALQRTVYLEQSARSGAPVAFSITYELTVFARHFEIDPKKVVPLAPDPKLAPYLEERSPHIVFTPEMRKFSREVVGEEKNPYLIARKLFDAVDRIPWGGAREYSTISSISDYALHAGHADCGQQTLLLMTLLRLNGIPARWQSGWIYSDVAYDDMHDWGWLYLAPYGWVPMDVTFGRLGGNDPAVDQFYFGSLDAYRLAFNDDYGQPLFPPKQHFRSETVDSQRGEVEWRGGNLYFDRWDYEFKAEVLGRTSQ
jgi:transglutaminase-like putative cysteine protease